MSDSDQMIERVFAGLREAESPAGLEGRILRAIEERTVREPVRFWNRVRKPGLAFAGAAAVVVVLAALTVRSLRSSARSAISREVAAVNLRAGADRAGYVPQRQDPLVGEEKDAAAKAAPLGEAGTSGRTIGFANERPSITGEEFATAGSSEALPSDPEALAVSEMLAPSKPAPPLPLTHQEKMLAQVARKGEPEELATLRPEVREKQMEISKAEYQEYFDPLTVKVNE